MIIRLFEPLFIGCPLVSKPKKGQNTPPKCDIKIRS
jgi:hypothetical protein